MVGNYLFANNATSRLRVMTPAASGTVTVAAGEGERFPEPTGEDFFMVTLDDRRTGQIEIMKCTARSGDVLTVLRAQEDTTAQDFAVGALLSNRPTAGTFQHFMETATGLAGWSKDEADERFVNRSGDSMLGYLELIAANPVLQTDATHKKYVDAQDATKAPLAHTHSIAQVIDLQYQLDIRPTEAPVNGKPYARYNSGWVDISGLATPSWDNIQGKPSTFPPAAHNHPISQVIDLQHQLDIRPTDAPADGVTYGRKNNAWEAAAGAASIGDSPPVGADDATFWWSTETGGLYILYDDGDSEQWVQVGGTALVDAVEEAPIDGQQYVRQDGDWAPVEVPIGGALISDTPPADVEHQTLWWSATTGVLAIRYNDGDSEQWVQISGGGGLGSGGLTDAPDDGKLYGRKDEAWSEVPAQAGDVYSTTETATLNKWIDGKTIYRKVVDMGTLPNSASTKVVAHGITGIAVVTGISGVMTTTGFQMPLPYLHPTNMTASVGIYMDPTSISAVCGADRSAYTARVYIEYTKVP